MPIAQFKRRKRRTVEYLPCVWPIVIVLESSTEALTRTAHGPRQTIGVSIAFKMAASTLRLSNTYIGAQFRRLRTKLGAPVAIKAKAMAAKLARLVYRMLRHGMKHVVQGAELYEVQHRKRQINHLKWKAVKLGFQIVEAPAA